jgi:hypothetical protein
MIDRGQIDVDPLTDFIVDLYFQLEIFLPVFAHCARSMSFVVGRDRTGRPLAKRPVAGIGLHRLAANPARGKIAVGRRFFPGRTNRKSRPAVRHFLLDTQGSIWYFNAHA